MNISKFIKNSENSYSDNLNDQFEKIAELVDNKTISPRFAKFLITYLIKKEVNELVRHNLEHILRKNNKEAWLMVNYNKKLTRYT